MKITEFKLAELKSACKSAGVRGYTSLPKSELIEWISASPRSAEILAALPGATTIECMDEKSSIEESKKGGIEEGATHETPATSSCMDEKSGIEEEMNEIASELRAFGGEMVDAIAAPPSECMDENENLEEGTDPEAGAKFKLIQSIRSLSSRLGAESEGIAQKLIGKSLTFCSVKELNLIFGRLAQLSQLVGTDDSEPIPDEELSEDEREANAFGAKFVADFLEGDGAIAPSDPEPSPLSAAFLCESINDNCAPQLKAEEINETSIKVTVQDSYFGGEDVHISRFLNNPTDWFVVKYERPWYWEPSSGEKAVDLALKRLLPMIREISEGDDAIAEPEEETEAEKQQAIDAIKLDLALATDGDMQPPPQHLRDRSRAIFDVDTPNGASFIPSNGTTGDIWESLWCERCIHFTESGCRIYIESLAGEPPEEWQYWDNKPLCTGFEEGIPPEEPITPPPPEASTACPIFYPGDIVCRFVEPYIVVGPDKLREGNWLVRSQEFPEAGEYSLNLMWPHLIAPSKSYKFPKEPQSQFSLWNLAIHHAHKIRLMDGWDNRDIAARLQDAGFQFANRIWDFCEFEGYEFLFSEFVTCGQWVIGRSGCAIVCCWDPHLFIWQIESQDLDFWVNQIKSWQSEWNEPVILKPWKTLLKATA